MAWRLLLGLLPPGRYLSLLTLCILQEKCSKVHVQGVQVCYICWLVPSACRQPIIMSSFPLASAFSSI
uniref:Secreted protein n=1 Tax=Macaca fascicularis TaxID=9541 RepID=A0A7N9CK03_MACFA